MSEPLNTGEAVIYVIVAVAFLVFVLVTGNSITGALIMLAYAVGFLLLVLLVGYLESREQEKEEEGSLDWL